MHTVRFVGLVLSGIPALAAQSFAYPDFANPTQLQLLGNATTAAGALRLVPNASLQSGWAWRQTPLAIPIGFSRGGLPIGAQIVGPYLEDRTTIHVAGLIEREFGGFVPPPPLTE